MAQIIEPRPEIGERTRAAIEKQMGVACDFLDSAEHRDLRTDVELLNALIKTRVLNNCDKDLVGQLETYIKEKLNNTLSQEHAQALLNMVL